MRKLLAAVTVLVTVSATGASGIAGADEPAPVPAPPGAGSAAPPEPQRGTPLATRTRSVVPMSSVFPMTSTSAARAPTGSPPA